MVSRTKVPPLCTGPPPKRWQGPPAERPPACRDSPSSLTLSPSSPLNHLFGIWQEVSHCGPLLKTFLPHRPNPNRLRIGCINHAPLPLNNSVCFCEEQRLLSYVTTAQLTKAFTLTQYFLSSPIHMPVCHHCSLKHCLPPTQDPILPLAVMSLVSFHLEQLLSLSWPFMTLTVLKAAEGLASEVSMWSEKEAVWGLPWQSSG